MLMRTATDDQGVHHLNTTSRDFKEFSLRNVDGQLAQLLTAGLNYFLFIYLFF